jgi:hypothetical protein
MRRSRAGRRLSRSRHRLRRRRSRFRIHGPHYGVRPRTHLQLPFESGGECGLVVGKRFPASDLLPYVIAQVVGAIAAAGVLYVIASGSASFDVHAGFASNGHGANSPGGYSLLAGFVSEVVLTAFFLIVIMGARTTERR